MQKLKIVYFGSPDFSAAFLEKIIDDKDLPLEVKLVVTQPDKPVGRKQTLTPTPVKKTAQKYNFPILETLHAPRFALHEIDLCLVYAYGEIIPKKMLNLPKYGFWNIHPSLLPKYRGASPIAYPLILGDEKTGVSLILMDEQLDHGSIIAQEEMEIKSEDTRSDLETKLTNLAFKTFKSVILNLFQDPNKMLKQVQHDIAPQDHSLAIYTLILKKSDGFIPLPILKKALKNEPIGFSDLPEFLQNYLKKYSINPDFLILNSKFLILNLYRGLFPWPGIWTQIPPGRWKGDCPKRLKIIKLGLTNNQIVLKTVQLEGKKPVDMATFNRAYPNLL